MLDFIRSVIVPPVSVLPSRLPTADAIRRVPRETLFTEHISVFWEQSPIDALAIRYAIWSKCRTHGNPRKPSLRQKSVSTQKVSAGLRTALMAICEAVMANVQKRIGIPIAVFHFLGEHRRRCEQNEFQARGQNVEVKRYPPARLPNRLGSLQPN